MRATLRRQPSEGIIKNVALEARDKKLRDQLRATEEDLRLKSSALLEADRQLAHNQARANSASGRLALPNQRAFAVPRLIDNSISVGCSTGRSDGAPSSTFSPPGYRKHVAMGFQGSGAPARRGSIGLGYSFDKRVFRQVFVVLSYNCLGLL